MRADVKTAVHLLGWLFPGGRPGRPLTSSQLLRRMTALGIQARPARNSALMEYAAQMPAVVLALLLRVAVPTATGGRRGRRPNRPHTRPTSTAYQAGGVWQRFGVTGSSDGYVRRTGVRRG
jgi:hypothetical protein